MTKIKASEAAQFGDQFAVRVQAFSAECLAWLEHMRRVDDDEKRGVAVEDAHAPYPRPVDHPLVMQAVNEDGMPDFEVVDDGPTAEEQMNKKKASLKAQVLAEVARRQHEAIPEGKRQSANFRMLDIRQGDVELRNARAREIEQMGITGRISGKVAAAIEDLNSPTFAHRNRSDEDASFVEDFERRDADMEDAARWGAKMTSEIEDLTSDTVDQWKMS